jgi:hypothetical protein
VWIWSRFHPPLTCVSEKHFVDKMEDPELIHHFKGHKEGITALHFNPSRKQVIVVRVSRNDTDPGFFLSIPRFLFDKK